MAPIKRNRWTPARPSPAPSGKRRSRLLKRRRPPSRTLTIVFSRLLTPEDVAKLFHCSESTVRKHAAGDRLPQLPGIKFGRKWLFRRETIERFLSEQEGLVG
jgi:excisionase family DNA binding protein